MISLVHQLLQLLSIPNMLFVPQIFCKSHASALKCYHNPISPMYTLKYGTLTSRSAYTYKNTYLYVVLVYKP